MMLASLQIEDFRSIWVPVDQGITASGVHDQGLASPSAPESTVNMPTKHQGVRPDSLFEVVRQWPMTDVLTTR